MALSLREKSTISRRIKENVAKLASDGLKLREKSAISRVIKEDVALLMGNTLPNQAPEPPTQPTDTQDPTLETFTAEDLIPDGDVGSPEALVQIALSRKDGNKAYVEFGAVKPEVAATIKDKIGIDVSGYVHSIDEATVRHIINHHGDEKTENQRGQIAVTPDDIKNINKITENPDNVTEGENYQGTKTVIYEKTIGDTAVYVQEIKEGRKRLAAKTLWKTHAAPPALANKTTVVPTSETLNALSSPQGTQSIAQPNKKASSTVIDDLPSFSPSFDEFKKKNTELSEIRAKNRWAGEIHDAWNAGHDIPEKTLNELKEIRPGFIPDGLADDDTLLERLGSKITTHIENEIDKKQLEHQKELTIFKRKETLDRKKGIGFKESHEKHGGKLVSLTQEIESLKDELYARKHTDKLNGKHALRIVGQYRDLQLKKHNDLKLLLEGAQSNNKSTETDPNVALLQDIAQGQYSHLNSEALLDMIEPAARALGIDNYAELIDKALLVWLDVDNKAFALDSVYREAA